MKITTIIIIIAILITGLAIYNMPQLKYPLDPQSKEIIQKTVDEFLDHKIHNNLWKRTFHFMTFFESLDGFYVAADASSIDKNEVSISTSAVLNNVAILSKLPSWQGLITFSQKSFMRTAFVVNSISDVTAYFIIGNLSSGEYYGFKLVDDTLKGVSYDGTTESTVDLKTISASTIYGIEARFYPNDKVVFYIDTEEVGVINTNLPSGITAGVAVANTYLFEINLKNTATAVKTLQFSFFEYLQHRNVLK